jgi:hypothetical protein
VFNFKSVVVKDLKDSANYLKFISNSSQFLSKLKSEKSWLKHNRYRRTLKINQEKIDAHISVDFSKSLKSMNKGQRIVILEIENTILFLSDTILVDYEEPLMTLAVSSLDKSKRKLQSKYLYVRKFGLEFLDFLCKTHDVILYTTLDTEVISVIIEMFQQIKKDIKFVFLVSGKPFIKKIHIYPYPIKSLNKFIDENHLDKFLILDCESLSYMTKYEDIFIPILPIV